MLNPRLTRWQHSGKVSKQPTTTLDSRGWNEYVNWQLVVGCFTWLVLQAILINVA